MKTMRIVSQTLCIFFLTPGGKCFDFELFKNITTWRSHERAQTAAAAGFRSVFSLILSLLISNCSSVSHVFQILNFVTSVSKTSGLFIENKWII